jgi:TetR/AcrR family transcriptional regulator, regulator of biofilm formation and stress response
MPKSTAQKDAPPDTREKILRAATELLVETGWQTVTTRRVATRAGVNQALVHYHFGSVDELLRQAMVGAMEREVTGLSEQLLASSSPGEGIRQISDWLRAFTPNSPMAVLSAEILARATRDAAIRDWMAGWLVQIRGEMAGTIEGWQASGLLRRDLPAQDIAVLVAALIDGLLFHGLIDPRLDIAEVARTLDVVLAAAQVKERN